MIGQESPVGGVTDIHLHVALNDPQVPGGSDPVLAPLLAATSDEERDEQTTALLADHALPVVDVILAVRLRRLGAHASALHEDLRGDVVVRLLHRLQRLLANPDAEPIHHFADYVAVVTYHRFDDFVRSTHPARAALSNRIRYVLGREGRFALWEVRGGRGLVAGLVEWRGREPSREDFLLHAPAQEDLQRLALGDVLAAVFARARAPLPLAELVNVVADLLGIVDPQLSGALSPSLPAAEPDPLAQLESMDYLRRLWGEIVALPLRQRIALLLSLRDVKGESVARLLPVTGTATREEIAATLELPGDGFTELWPKLPLDDLGIGQLLGGLARQQVINLRKSARERLARRMARFEDAGRRR